MNNSNANNIMSDQSKTSESSIDIDNQRKQSMLNAMLGNPYNPNVQQQQFLGGAGGAFGGGFGGITSAASPLKNQQDMMGGADPESLSSSLLNLYNPDLAQLSYQHAALQQQQQQQQQQNNNTNNNNNAQQQQQQQQHQQNSLNSLSTQQQLLAQAQQLQMLNSGLYQPNPFQLPNFGNVGLPPFHMPPGTGAGHMPSAAGGMSTNDLLLRMQQQQHMANTTNTNEQGNGNNNVGLPSEPHTMANAAMQNSLKQELLSTVEETSKILDNEDNNNNKTLSGGGIKRKQSQEQDIQDEIQSGGLKKRKTRHDDVWDEMFERLLRYKEMTGSVTVPRNYGADPKLGRWVQTQRMRRGNLREDRRERLESINFEWCLQEHESWDVVFNRLLDYKKEYGDTIVPQHFKKDPKLGEWVDTQRKKKDKLAPDRKRRLEEVGFVWSVRDSLWKNMFDKLKKYKEEHGDCCVTWNYKKDPQLVRWVYHQRRRKHGNLLLEKQIQDLDSVGFEWNNRKN